MRDHHFAVAPMSRLIKLLTVFVCALPFLFVFAASGPAGTIMSLSAALVAALIAFVYAWSRPTGIEVDSRGLVVRFPLRRMEIPTRQLVAAERLELGPFRQRYGNVARVGVGGLFGVFGWFWGPRAGWFEVHSTRHDHFVVISRRDRMPLILSPDDEAGLVAAVNAVAEG